MKGMKQFARQMFSKSLKDSFSYIFTVAITVMLVFITVNMSFNEVMYANGGEVITIMQAAGSPTNPIYVPTDVSVKMLQMQLAMVTIIIVAVFTVITNSTYLKRRVKELAFVITNGATISEMSYYIRYMCSKLFIAASVLGIFLGIIFMPLFTSIMYKLVGVEGPLFLYYGETFLVIVSFIFINYVYLMMASTSYIYKKQVSELMDDNATKNTKDTRMVKFPSIIYVLVYFIPILVLFLPKSFGDVSGFISVAVYISVIASIGVVAMYIPSKMKSLNNTKFMDDKERKIYIFQYW